MSLVHAFFQDRVDRDLDEVRRRISFDRERRRDDRDRLRALEDDVGRLALLVTTVYRLLGEKGVVTREEFAAAAAAIDALDGVLDGRSTGPLP